MTDRIHEWPRGKRFPLLSIRGTYWMVSWLGASTTYKVLFAEDPLRRGADPSREVIAWALTDHPVGGTHWYMVDAYPIEERGRCEAIWACNDAGTHRLWWNMETQR